MTTSPSPLLLIGVGGAGCSTVRAICRSFNSPIRTILADTDASTGQNDENFILLGGDRLSGRGTGGSLVDGRMAATDSLKLFEPRIAGVRLAVIVTCTGGGTSGAAIEISTFLKQRGIVTLIFATTPFCFESTERLNTSRGARASLADTEVANASIILPLDELVAGEDNMTAALSRAIDTLAKGITLFWRLIEKPGYIRLDIESLRHLISTAGRGRFISLTQRGEDRAQQILQTLVTHPLLTHGKELPRTILCGILAGDDLRLSEVATVANGVRTAFNKSATFELSTVNDEETFPGILGVVIFLFESPEALKEGEATFPATPTGKNAGRRRENQLLLNSRQSTTSWFSSVLPTLYNNENLDTPTYAREKIRLDP